MLSIVPEPAWTVDELADVPGAPQERAAPAPAPSCSGDSRAIHLPFKPMGISLNDCHDRCGCFES